MKAIAIVDIDDELIEEYEDFAIECNLIATSKEESSWRDSVRWLGAVKLKPLPKKRNEHWLCNESWDLESIINAENRGWNACIDEIVGEEE